MSTETESAMKIIVNRGAKALNPKSMRWQMINKDTKLKKRLTKRRRNSNVRFS